MRKVYATLMFAFLLVLTGCSGETAYEKFKGEVESIQNLDQLIYKVELTSGEMTFNVEAQLDEANKTEYLNFLGMEVYVDQDYGYLKLLGTWIKSAMDEEDIASLNEDLDLSIIEVTLPEGTTTAYDAFGQDEDIKAEYGDKTLNEIVVETEDNVYSFKGEEEFITLTVKDNQLTIDATDPDDETTTMTATIGEGEEVVIPDEAKKAKESDEAFQQALSNLEGN